MAVNRVAGLVMPLTSKPLLDKVRLRHSSAIRSCCPGSSLGCFGAMLVQAITSFSLTQLLSKAGQRLIAEMRRAGAAACGPAFRGLLR